MLSSKDSLLSATNSLDHTLMGRFHVLENNLAPEGLHQARIFFLGTTHYRISQAWIISSLIERLYQEGDLVLIESHETTCFHAQFVAKQIEITDWDPRGAAEAEETKFLIDILFYIDHVRQYGLEGEDWTKLIMIEFAYPQPKKISPSCSMIPIPKEN